MAPAFAYVWSLPMCVCALVCLQVCWNVCVCVSVCACMCVCVHGRRVGSESHTTCSHIDIWTTWYAQNGNALMHSVAYTIQI